MPKIKSHSGAKKRFKKTGTGKIRYKQSFLRHILTSKSTKGKRKLRGTNIMDDVETSRINKLLPYI